MVLKVLVYKVLMVLKVLVYKVLVYKVVLIVGIKLDRYR